MLECGRYAVRFDGGPLLDLDADVDAEGLTVFTEDDGPAIADASITIASAIAANEIKGIGYWLLLAAVAIHFLLMLYLQIFFRRPKFKTMHNHVTRHVPDRPRLERKHQPTPLAP